MLYNLSTITNKDWYRWGVYVLLPNQFADGSWFSRQYPTVPGLAGAGRRRVPGRAPRGAGRPALRLRRLPGGVPAVDAGAGARSGDQAPASTTEDLGRRARPAGRRRRHVARPLRPLVHAPPRSPAYLRRNALVVLGNVGSRRSGGGRLGPGRGARRPGRRRPDRAGPRGLGRAPGLGPARRPRRGPAGRPRSRCVRDELARGGPPRGGARRDPPPARHQRLPAEDRRDPVVPVGAVAPAAARRRPPCSPRRTTARRRGTRRSRSGSSATREQVLLPTPVARARRIDALAAEVGADAGPARPGAAARAASARRSSAPTAWSLHGAEVTVPGPAARVAPRCSARCCAAPSSSSRPAATPPPRRERGRRARRCRPWSCRPASTPSASGRSTPSSGPTPAGALRPRPRRRARGRRQPARAPQGLRRADRRGRRARAPAVPTWCSSIAGGGRDRGRLERLAPTRGAPVRFLGRVVRRRPARRSTACADVFAMLCRNRWLGLEQEGFGIVFLEAAACGVPAGGRAPAADRTRRSSTGSPAWWCDGPGRRGT